MDLEEIKSLVAKARDCLEQYNTLANRLAAVGVTIEVDTSHSPHGVVGVGRVDARTLSAQFTIEL